MALSQVKTDESHFKLMMAIREVVQAHTTLSPMAIDEIVGVLGFCAGSAIVSGCKSPANRRKMRAVVVSNVDNGMDVMLRAATGTSLIIPGVTH